MNDMMWANRQTQLNVAHLRELEYTVLDPDVGPLAAGEGSGPGRMPEPETILAHAGRMLEKDAALAGRRLVVTAGATREPIDPVRFISNHSSGRMGAAIAAAAWRRGADVTLVTGHLEVAPPAGVSAVSTGSTDEMAEAVQTAMRDADALIMAAAPADFRPAAPATTKLAKTEAMRALELTATTDILAAASSSRRRDAPGQGGRTATRRTVIVGFALETGDAEEKGRTKLASKDLDLIVVNDQMEAGAGLAGETNRVTLLGRDGTREELPLMLKAELADVLLDRVAKLLDGR